MMTPLLLTVLSSILFVVAIYLTFLSYRRYRVNMFISEELHKVIDNTTETIAKSKKFISEEKQRLHHKIEQSDMPPDNIMDSPELMATIITVLVHKIGGEVRLGLRDFMIPDEEGVSVYVDTDTQEILLSTDHKLALDDTLLSFTNPDDNTYH